MYQDSNMLASIRKVEAAREENAKLDPRRMTAEEKETLLKKFHPDYRAEQFTELRFGPNQGQKVPLELAELLEGESRILHETFDLTKPDYETDVLIIGGGGAGCSAAIEADNAGAKVMVVTKLRMGDANTMMAEGGIQAADKPNDSPAQHFLDAYGGGHFAAQKDLLYKLVMDAPEAIQWLSGLGVEFDKAPDGTMITTHGGGTSRKRMHAAKDYSGAEIMRTLRDEVLNRGIPVVDFTSAVELIKDENGRCAGAVLLNMETKELLVAKAKTVILATGGAGRLHYQGFPTSNHYGATADGLVLGYRAGAKLLYPDTLQYHPTGAAYPAQIYGALVTEKVRSVGAMLVNADGEVFMNPLETRDVAAASIIRECTERGKGVKTPAGQAVWLDTPMIELKNGAGTIEKRIPAMMRMFAKHGIDIRKEPILVYPTLHYQNGGLHITADGQTDVENLFAAGEVVGGIHGRNRLMGNSLLDVIVFGRNAGQHAAEKAKSVTVGALTLDHVAAFEAEKQQAGVTDHHLSPQLLPDYARKIHPAENKEK
ncbi:MAG: FAD-dependent oxidoreductase [Acutalibacteraceae bacterium]